MEEPKELRKGKLFHGQIQTEWMDQAEGDVRIEYYLTKPNGRMGRADILVDLKLDMVAVAEIKSSDWDRMTKRALKANVRRQIRQILSYVDSQLSLGKEVCPGVMFPERPSAFERVELIEKLFNDEGIQVVWNDETIEECRKRNNSRTDV